MKRCFGLIFLILSGHFLFAQDQLADNLKQQFYNYQSNALQEKLFVHTDKTFYLAGETIWFKIYAVDESFHKPLDLSRVAYIELISREMKPVLHAKISMKAGTGNGSISIPGSLGSGNYLLRAYTSWMKNFPADYFYEQSISIVNTLKGKASDESPAASMAAIQFFPEGGNLVDGLPSKIAFKATGESGRGLNCEGAIINQKKDTITRFHSFHNGMGTFQLVPQKDDTYYAVVKLEDSTFIQKLTEPYEQGFTLSLSTSDPEKIKVNVGATSTFLNTDVYLFVHSSHSIKNVQVNQIRDGEAVFYVAKSALGDGISTFTLFNASRQPVCERLFYKRPGEQMLIQTKTDKQVYAPRKEVTVEITTSDNLRPSCSANMSMSVFMLDSLQDLPKENIVSYLFLTSDLKGIIESPDYYIGHTDAESDQAIDNLLLTQGWRRFKWEDLFNYRQPAFEFLPEIEGPIVNGRVEDKNAGVAGKGIPFYLSVPGTNFGFSSATSKGDGSIRFTFKNIYKSNIIVLQAANQKDSNFRLDISNAYADKFSTTVPAPLSLSKKWEAGLLKRSINAQVENTYNFEIKHSYLPGSVSDSIPFYGRPDRLYHLDDYTRFVTMEEVMREFVEDVRIRKEDDKFRFRVRNILFNIYFDDGPLILLDGLPVFDASKIIALDPLKINNIEVVSRRFFTGPSVVDGIVSVKSYSGELGASQLDPNAILFEYDGLQQQREFYSPAYTNKDQENSPIPDFRNVLSWSPQVVTGKSGKTQLSFFTSDLVGKFAVVIQGISPDGLPGAAVSTFEVAGSK